MLLATQEMEEEDEKEVRNTKQAGKRPHEIPPAAQDTHTRQHLSLSHKDVISFKQQETCSNRRGTQNERQITQTNELAVPAKNLLLVPSTLTRLKKRPKSLRQHTP